MPKDITGVNIWTDPIIVPIDGEPVVQIGPGGIGSERVYQAFANRDAYLRAQIAAVDLSGVITRLDGIDTRINGVDTTTGSLQTQIGNLQTQANATDGRVNNVFGILSATNTIAVQPAVDFQTTISDPNAVESSGYGQLFTGQHIQRRSIAATFAWYLTGGIETCGMGVYRSLGSVPPYKSAPNPGDSLVCTTILPSVPALQTVQITATGFDSLPVGQGAYYYITVHGPVGTTMLVRAAWTIVYVREG